MNKTILYVALVVLVSSVVYGGYCNLNTQQYQENKPQRLGDVHNPDPDTLVRYGWRTVSLTSVPDDRHLMSRSFEAHPTDPYAATDTIVTVDKTIWEAEQAAAAAIAASNAAEIARNPIPFPKGIEVPVLVLIDNVASNYYGVAVDSNGTLITYLDHASPRPSDEEIAARVASQKVVWASIRLDLRTIKLNIETNITETRALSGSAFSGDQKTTINAILKKLVDSQQECQKLRKALTQTVKGE